MQFASPGQSAQATGGRIKIEVFRSARLFVRSIPSTRSGPVSPTCIIPTKAISKRSRRRSISSRPYHLASPQTSCSRGSSTAADKNCGTHSAAQFNVKSFLACTTGPQTGGWFAREVTSPEGFKGLRYRMTGPGGDVLRRLGAIVVILPGGEIVPALKSGAIDGGEFAGPWMDMGLGLHTAVGIYLYYPGFHEPGTGIAVGINKRLWESLDASNQRVIEACVAGEYAQSLAEFSTNNALSLRRLRDEGIVKILKLDDSVLKALFEISKDVVAEIGSGDDLSRKIYASYQQFRSSIMDWSDVAERAYMNSRRLA